MGCCAGFARLCSPSWRGGKAGLKGPVLLTHYCLQLLPWACGKCLLCPGERPAPQASHEMEPLVALAPLQGLAGGTKHPCHHCGHLMGQAIANPAFHPLWLRKTPYIQSMLDVFCRAGGLGFLQTQILQVWTGNLAEGRKPDEPFVVAPVEGKGKILAYMFACKGRKS